MGFEKTLLLSIVPFLAGCGLVVQSGLNATLADELGHPIFASWASFLCGTIFFAVVVLARARFSVRNWKPTSGRENLYPLLGGSIGALYVTGTVFIVATIGYAIMFVCIIAGMSLSALVFDNSRRAAVLFNLPRRPATRAKAAATTLFIVGAAVTVVEALAGGSWDVPLSAVVALAVTSIALGALLPLQSGINARVGQILQSPIGSALTSFAVGTLGLTVGLVIVAAADPDRAASFRAGVPTATAALGIVTGLLGALYVQSAIFLTPVLGSSPYYGLLMAGQLASSLLLDAIGFSGSATRPVTPLRALGVGIAFLALAVAQFAKAREDAAQKPASPDAASPRDGQKADIELPVVSDTV